MFPYTLPFSTLAPVDIAFKTSFSANPANMDSESWVSEHTSHTSLVPRPQNGNEVILHTCSKDVELGQAH